MNGIDLQRYTFCVSWYLGELSIKIFVANNCKQMFILSSADVGHLLTWYKQCLFVFFLFISEFYFIKQQ